MAIVGIATAAIVMQLEGFTHWDLFTKVVLTTAATVCTVWCIWVVHSFHGILTWWQDMHHNMEMADSMLKEAKSDLKEIKDLAKPS
jgi:hypothetical protein